MTQMNTGGWEGFRVEARELIADVSHPFTYINNYFSRVKRGIENGEAFAAFSSAFVHGASLMLEEVKARCPVDDGDLKDSLHVTTEDDTDFHGSKSKGTISVANTFAYISTELVYAAFVEYGTSRAPAHPFMRPAADAGAAAFAGRVGDAIGFHVVTGFWGGLAIDLLDVGLAHAGKKPQKHGLARDVAGVFVGAAVGRAAGKVGGKLGRKALGKGGKGAGKAAGKTRAPRGKGGKGSGGKGNGNSGGKG